MVQTSEATLIEDLQQTFAHYRSRRQQLFAMLSDAVYVSRPIPLRNPLVFYEGHMCAFNYRALLREGLGAAALDEPLETLFARGIDPHEDSTQVNARGNQADRWPARATVQAFCHRCDQAVEHALSTLDGSDERLVEAACRMLEHEAMHHETLMYQWLQIPHADKQAPADYRPQRGGAAPRQEMVSVPAGRAELGIAPGERAFVWDNEMPAHGQEVPAFSIQRYKVSNAAFLEFVTAGGYEQAQWWAADDWQWLQQRQHSHPHFWCYYDDQWWWRGMFSDIPLPPAWPVWVTHAEASAYARWLGMRLPSEAEYQRAALGDASGQQRSYPWGEEPPDERHGAYDFASWDPQPLGSHPHGRSAWGIDDLVGNGWEWTHTVFAPFPSFSPMPTYPEYSADFFDNDHVVLKGASPFTPRQLLRPSFRNWFRRRYPFVCAGFRCVAQGAP